MSTLVTTKGAFGSNPNIAIIVPKGTSGAYIEQLSFDDYKKQREFLFNSGSRIEKLTNDSETLIYRIRGGYNETK
ncbi:hypothetical protein G6Z84_02850 [Lactobacillus iners]|nr:hypothetical protein G6Z84_02850 [Lactobacillus iners]